jgi:hypothetical protein
MPNKVKILLPKEAWLEAWKEKHPDMDLEIELTRAQVEAALKELNKPPEIRPGAIVRCKSAEVERYYIVTSENFTYLAPKGLVNVTDGISGHRYFLSELIYQGMFNREDQ